MTGQALIPISVNSLTPGHLVQTMRPDQPKWVKVSRTCTRTTKVVYENGNTQYVRTIVQEEVVEMTIIVDVWGVDDLARDGEVDAEFDAGSQHANRHDWGSTDLASAKDISPLSSEED